MDQLPGAMGSSGSLALRVGQLIFSVASIAFMYMGIPFHSYTTFCCFFLVDVNVASQAYEAKIGHDSLYYQVSTSLWHVCNDMDQLPGAVGSSGSLALRVGQLIFSAASIAFMYMGIPLHSYTAFCFLMVVMSLVMVWSLIFALMDLFAVLFKAPIHLPAILALAVLGDCVLSFLSLAASCSTAGVVEYLMHSSSSLCEGNLCTRYQLSATMAFFAWFLTFASSLFNLWLLPTI